MNGCLNNTTVALVSLNHFLPHVDHGGCVANNRLTIFDRYDKVLANGATFILYVFEVQMGHSVAKI